MPGEHGPGFDPSRQGFEAGPRQPSAYDKLFAEAGAPSAPAHTGPEFGGGEFAHLFEHRVKPADEPWPQERYEQAINPERAKLLFAPVPPSPEEGEEGPDKYNFDYLFDPNYQPPQEVPGLHHAEEAIRPMSQTPDSRQAAASQLIRALGNDARLREITDGFLATHASGFSDGTNRIDHLVDSIHTDPSLRVAVGMHYLSKLEMLAHESGLALPPRVLGNDEKRPHKPQPGTGYDRIKSREYVAQLCLAMLDGTFDSNDESGDKVQTERLNRGEDAPGQHRYAARLLLERYTIDEEGKSYLYS